MADVLEELGIEQMGDTPHKTFMRAKGKPKIIGVHQVGSRYELAYERPEEKPEERIYPIRKPKSEFEQKKILREARVGIEKERQEKFKKFEKGITPEKGIKGFKKEFMQPGQAKAVGGAAALRKRLGGFGGYSSGATVRQTAQYPYGGKVQRTKFIIGPDGVRTRVAYVQPVPEYQQRIYPSWLGVGKDGVNHPMLQQPNQTHESSWMGNHAFLEPDDGINPYDAIAYDFFGDGGNAFRNKTTFSPRPKQVENERTNRKWRGWNFSSNNFPEWGC